MAASADYVRQQPEDATQPIERLRVGEVQGQLEDLGVVGWPQRTTMWAVFGDFRCCSMKLAGLLTTVIAVCMGAPFWFDLLNKVVDLRAAGKRPEA